MHRLTSTKHVWRTARYMQARPPHPPSRSVDAENRTSMRPIRSSSRSPSANQSMLARQSRVKEENSANIRLPTGSSSPASPAPHRTREHAASIPSPFKRRSQLLKCCKKQRVSFLQNLARRTECAFCTASLRTKREGEKGRQDKSCSHRCLHIPVLCAFSLPHTQQSCGFHKNEC